MLFESRIPFDGVVIFDCAGERDMRTARHLHDNLLHICRVEAIKVEDRRQFFRELRRLADRCSGEGRRPILHIDAHGSPSLGVQVGPDLVSWKELGERLTRINAACENGLGVVMAACHGIYGLDALDIEWPSPFAFMVGPPDTIEQGVLRDTMSRFYLRLLATGSLSQGEEELRGAFAVVRSAMFFYSVFRRVYLAQSIGRGAQRHVEALVTKAVTDGIVRDKQHLAAVRKALRYNNRYPEKTYLRVGGKFMHGQPLVPFADFIASITQE